MKNPLDAQHENGENDGKSDSPEEQTQKIRADAIENISLDTRTAVEELRATPGLVLYPSLLEFLGTLDAADITREEIIILAGMIWIDGKPTHATWKYALDFLRNPKKTDEEDDVTLDLNSDKGGSDPEEKKAFFGFLQTPYAKKLTRKELRQLRHAKWSGSRKPTVTDFIQGSQAMRLLRRADRLH